MGSKLRAKKSRLYATRAGDVGVIGTHFISLDDFRDDLALRQS